MGRAPAVEDLEHPRLEALRVLHQAAECDFARLDAFAVVADALAGRETSAELLRAIGDVDVDVRPHRVEVRRVELPARIGVLGARVMHGAPNHVQSRRDARMRAVRAPLEDRAREATVLPGHRAEGRLAVESEDAALKAHQPPSSPV
jgi:hypothetical protein